MRRSDQLTLRRDLSRFFGCWIGAANVIWLVTPWLQPLAPSLGPPWIWTTVIPAASLVALNPRLALGLVAAAGALVLRAAAQLTRPCRFRAARG